VKKGEDGHKKKSVIVPVVASIASIAVLIGALVLFFILRKKKSPKVEGILSISSRVINIHNYQN